MSVVILADEIRLFAFENNIKPARMAGVKSVRINAGAIHSAMALRRRLAAVCRALGANKFCRQYELTLISRSSP
jgi:hypothetical protein